MEWIELKDTAQLETIKTESHQKPVIIFKHSTRCSISRAVLDRLERNWALDTPAAKPYFLDLLTYRSLSNQIAADFDIEHESPQAIIIFQGKPVYAESHFGINLHEIKRVAANAGAFKN